MIKHFWPYAVPGIYIYIRTNECANNKYIMESRLLRIFQKYPINLYNLYKYRYSICILSVQHFATWFCHSLSFRTAKAACNAMSCPISCRMASIFSSMAWPDFLHDSPDETPETRLASFNSSSLHSVGHVLTLLQW